MCNAFTQVNVCYKLCYNQGRFAVPRTVQCGVHVGGGQGVGGACAPASGGGVSSVRRLELPLLGRAG